MSTEQKPVSDDTQSQGGGWLLMKRGLYWRPNGQGYTGLKSEAGRYTYAEAMARTGHDRKETTAIREDEASEFSPDCAWETKLKAMEARLKRAELLAAAIPMCLESDHATLKRMWFFFMTGRDEPVGSLPMRDLEKMASHATASHPSGRDLGLGGVSPASAVGCEAAETPEGLVLVSKEMVSLIENTLELYADPTGYTDGHEDPYPPDAEVHPGRAAADALEHFRAMLSTSPKPHHPTEE